MPVQKNPIVTLSATIPQIFQDCQKSTSNHRTNAIALRKVQMKCSSYRSSNNESSNNQLDNEQAFNAEFIRNLNKILPVKKGQPNAERVMKFVASFVAFSCEKDKELLNNQNDNTTDYEDDDYEDTLSSRFAECLIQHLLKGIEANDKNIRLRVCHLIAHLIGCLGSIDDDLYERLNVELTKRLLDKEAGVRVKAVLACSKLQGDDDHGKYVIEKFIGMLRNDPSGNFSSYIATCTGCRSNKSSRCYCIMKIAEEINDFRVLSIEDREKLLSWGLTDRDPHVKKACVRMLSTSWIQHANDNLLELLERLDVVGSNIAQEALISIFNARPDIVQMLNFEDIFWENLTAEGSFLVRVFCEYNKEDEGKLDEILPEVTRLAFYIQKYNNFMNQASDEEQVNLAFIVGQLFLLAKLLDYGDEVGRRKMCSLLREMLMSPNILECHIESIVEIEKKISINERDFTRSMIEIITDIREGIEDDEAPSRLTYQDDYDLSANMSRLSINISSMKMSVLSTDLKQTERRRVSNSSTSMDDSNILQEDNEMKVILVNLKCLHIIRCMLEKNSEPLAVENYNLFMHCLRHGHPELQIKSLMVMSDILMAYGYSTIVSSTRLGNDIIGLLQECLTNENEQLQAIAVVLKELVSLYFDSDTASNLCLRQCLSYFFPVFCHSSFENQTLMQEIFLPTLIELLKKYKNVDKNDNAVPPLQIAQQLVDWTDPFKVVKLEQTEETIDYGSHAELAISVIRELFSETDMARNALNKFENALLGYFDDAPDALDDNELEQLKEIVEFVEQLEDYADR
ncbi:nuclear condensing complex subunit [Gigaspora rosea]|uniref:Nuclear condensing complex subunit n=1 Tax=Gigaspora rosea TaxID=44941 RepID=A0A397U379_9GLOM|nr:nuclear condensing complex subunit [Gigaspora rosea]